MQIFVNFLTYIFTLRSQKQHKEFFNLHSIIQTNFMFEVAEAMCPILYRKYEQTFRVELTLRGII